MKTKTVQHTPTPWTINKIYNRNIYGLMKGVNQLLATCYMREEENESDGEGEANAAFVVRAVNAHEELLEALKGLTKEINLSELNIRKNFSLINAHAYALKAVAKAEGR